MKRKVSLLWPQFKMWMVWVFYFLRWVNHFAEREFTPHLSEVWCPTSPRGGQQVISTFLIRKCSNYTCLPGLTTVDTGDNGIIQFDTQACFVISMQENRRTFEIYGNETKTTWRYFTNYNIVSFEEEHQILFIIEQRKKQHFIKIDKVEICLNFCLTKWCILKTTGMSERLKGIYFNCGEGNINLVEDELSCFRKANSSLIIDFFNWDLR